MAKVCAPAPLSVLVVDDTPAVSATLVWVLRQNGYNCCAAATRAEALRLSAALAPDLALIEADLPDGGGVAAARDLRRALPACRMFLMSSDPEAADRVLRARAAGFDCELLPKPIPVEELLQRVKEALAQPA